MPDGKTLAILALAATVYVGVAKVRKPVTAVAKHAAHDVVHVVTFGKK